MEYQALYRKYRPSKWEDVVGQKHITTALTNQIKNNAISHAYLFCGTRGTGKTSIARIFAKAINCENPVNGSPCGRCDTCRALSDANNMDIMEIDAASNNRVDEIRELREKIKYPPINGRYKVYIIDEVHMLTDSAFNALLKTLEEPPHYVVFILGTTEVQKLPATILSRCLRFDFKLISSNELEELLEKIFKDSGIDYEKEAISLIAKLGEGSARDTLSIADMCVAYTNRNVTYDAVVEAVGATDKKTLHQIAECLLQGQVTNLLQLVDNIATNGKNISQLAKDLAGYFRDIAVVKTCKNFGSILKYPQATLDELSKLAEYDITRVLDVLKSLSGLEQEFRYTQNPRALLEVVLLGIVSGISEVERLEKRVADLEKQKSGKDIPLTATMTATISKPVAEVKKEFAPIVNGDQVFGQLLINLREAQEFKIYVMLNSVVEHKVNGNVLNIKVNSKTSYESLVKDNNLRTLNNYLSKINSKLTINFEYVEAEQKVDIEDMLKNQFGNMFSTK